MKTKSALLFAVFAYMLGGLFFASPAPVQTAEPLAITCGNGQVPDPLGLDCVSHTGLKKTDPRIVAGRMVKVVLSLLGVLFTVLTVYAGFTWMTSAGNEESVTKARKILSASVIGIIIILMSYSITNFVLKNVSNATVTDGSPIVY